MSWSPNGVRVPGRPRDCWYTQLEAFARFNGNTCWTEYVTNFFDIARGAFIDFVQH